MWKKGFSVEKNMFYWTLRISESIASMLYSALCDELGLVSITKCLNQQVSWVKGNYNFIIWGPEKKDVDYAKNRSEEILRDMPAMPLS